MTRARLIWTLPALAFAIGAVVVVLVTVQQRAMLDRYRQGFEAHAASVTKFSQEVMSEATEAVELLYDLAEKELGTTARWLGGLDPALRSAAALEQDIAVFVVGVPPLLDGAWGAVEVGERTDLVRQVLEAAEGELVDAGVARRHGLHCLHVAWRGAQAVACRGAAKLIERRRQAGLAPLLRAAAGQGVRFIAIQDHDGMVARSAGAGRLSAWDEDPLLARALTAAQPLFRRVDGDDGRALIEGLSAFPLPDGTTAVLRVGVDATALVEAEASVAHGYHILLAVMAALLVLALLLTVVLDRWQKQRLMSEQALAAHEAENRHWQAIGQMAATVAHEVRNPLNTLEMAAQRLAREFAVPEAERAEFAELTGVIRSEAERVNRVVTEFLELGRPLRLERTAIDAGELIEEAVLPAKLRAVREAKSLAVENRCRGVVDVDRRRFAQVMNNLTSNALDAVAAGGHVVVKASCEDDGLHLAVEDDGEGMDEEGLRRAQQPFVTTRAQGTGLGLPLAERLVRAHGGTLRISSAPGRGTQVDVRLPRTKESSEKGV